jgi:hypothetical protein
LEEGQVWTLYQQHIGILRQSRYGDSDFLGKLSSQGRAVPGCFRGEGFGRVRGGGSGQQGLVDKGRVPIFSGGMGEGLVVPGSLSLFQQPKE